MQERTMCQVKALRNAESGVLLAAATGHDAGLAAMLVIISLLISAVLVVVLVCLTSRNDRVEAIRAAAEVLRVLLPWTSHRPAPERPEPRAGEPDDQDDHPKR
jgi:putative exporter of polyketide antibiotics